jgi:site-specific DNA-methyltransferase (adenine-specific)
VMKQLPKVDHTIADPPFEWQAHSLQRRTKPGGGVTALTLGFAPIDETLRTEAARLMARLTRRWTLIFCQAESLALWRVALEAGGARYRRACIWVAPDKMPQFSGDRPGMGFESLVVCHAPGKSRWNGHGRHGVFIHNKGGEGPGPNEHQTQKPLRLMKELVMLFTDPGETILDPFCGSGSTLRAARDLGRKSIGIDVDERCCAIAARRMSQMVFDFGKVG